MPYYHDQVSVSGASGTTYSRPAIGTLLYIKVTYTNGDAGGDVTITDDETGVTFLTLTNNNTNKEGTIVKQVIDTVGPAVSSTYDKMPVTSRFKVVVAQEAANSVVTVDFWWLGN